MRPGLENLPSDIDLPRRLVRDMAAVVETRYGEIDRLQRIIKQLQRGQFGGRSERLDPDRLSLGLGHRVADIARTEARDAVPSADDPVPGTAPGRLP